MGLAQGGHCTQTQSGLAKGTAVPTHGFGLCMVCTEEADDAGPTAHIQDHFILQGLFILQDNVVVFGCSRLICQHLQVQFLEETPIKNITACHQSRATPSSDSRWRMEPELIP